MKRALADGSERRNRTRRGISWQIAGGLALAVALGTPSATPAAAADSAGIEEAPGAALRPLVLAQGDAVGGTRDRDLEPRYRPVEPEPESWYDSSYLFAVTRSVANSTLHPAAKAPLFVLAVPVDLAILPFEVLGGLF